MREADNEIAAYNYSEFVGSEKFLEFRAVLPVGFDAPDVSATLLETGRPVRLSDYWRERDVLMEFGSLT